MTSQEIKSLFEELGVVLNGHFLLTSGKHSPTFLQCSQLFQYPEHTAKVAKALAEKFKDTKAEVIIGPAMGGVILSYEVARHLGLKSMYAEKDGNGGMVFKRGFKLAPGTKVLIVEDAVSTGGSVKKVITACDNVGLDIVGIGVLVDRSAGKVKLHKNQQALLSMEVPAYESNACPLCEKNLSLTHPKDLSM